MMLIEAAIKSNCWTAERVADRGYKGRKIVVKYFGQAPFNEAHFRIVTSATDPTVQGKLSARQLSAGDWEPINL